MVNDLSLYDIIEEFYNGQGELAVFVLQEKADRDNLIFVRANELWTNECHNCIMGYIQAKNLPYNTFSGIRGYRRARCIMTMRFLCDCEQSLLEVEFYSDSNEMSDGQCSRCHKAIARRWGNPDRLKDLLDRDLDEWITKLTRMNEWSPLQWNIKWQE